jgi:hypothetical protein
MGTLKTFLDSKKISAAKLELVSKQLEAHDAEAHTLMVKRAEKRRVKETAEKKYAELNIAKPKTMGRGLSGRQIEAALSDKPLPRKVRSKVFRAVNHILGAQKQPAVDMKALFEGTTVQLGKKKEEAKAAAAKA